MRLGIDLGGTKTEIIALDRKGTEIHRKRVDTDTRSYQTVLTTIIGLVKEAEAILGEWGTVGVGIPGTISAQSGLVKNANTTILNGHPLDKDLGRALEREVRCSNDANCLALSEAVDGAAQGRRIVFAAILGTGCGAGIAIDAQLIAGNNLVAGEWGHNPLPWMNTDEFPGPMCWCGKRSCIEKWLSGTGFAEEYNRSVAKGEPGSTIPLKAEQIVNLARSKDAKATAALTRYADRLARSLAHVINILDPDIIVLGGGMSNVDELYESVPPLLASYVFGSESKTPMVRSKHGDSSGVRGAAWLWDRE
jgi:fructokinase